MLDEHRINELQQRTVFTSQKSPRAGSGRSFHSTERRCQESQLRPGISHSTLYPAGSGTGMSASGR